MARFCEPNGMDGMRFILGVTFQDAAPSRGRIVVPADTIAELMACNLPQSAPSFNFLAQTCFIRKAAAYGHTCIALRGVHTHATQSRT